MKQKIRELENKINQKQGAIVAIKGLVSRVKAEADGQINNLNYDIIYLRNEIKQLKSIKN